MSHRAAMRVILMGAWCAATVGRAASFTDDFGGYAAGSDGSPAWEPTGIEWEMRDGQFVASGKARSFAVYARAPLGRSVQAVATIHPRKATGTDWKTAGVAIVLDERNYWHFALVEGPDKAGRKHFVELCEMLDGTWLSQHEPATRLTEVQSVGADFQWQYGQKYYVSITLSENEIWGALLSPEGRTLALKRYKLDNRAVKSGRPALTCGGLEVAFDLASVRSDDPVPEPERPKPAFPPFTQAGRVPLPDEPKGRATGFFHVEEHDGRWWVIDPKGRPFFVVGTDHANYRVHWCEKLGYAPYHRNMTAKFKGDEAAWAADTAERLLAWGFNALGASHSPSLRGRGLAWMGFVSCGVGFSDVSDLCPKVHWTGFPNVFDPRFPRYCELRARQVCAPHRDDPWLIGHFIDNELEWYGKEHREWSLVDEVFKKPADHSGKQALIAFLKERYPKIERLNAAWGTSVASYDALAASTEPLRHKTEQGRKDKLAFLALIAEKYFAITSAAIRKHDPNHMVLGARFAGGFPPGVGEAAGKHCDIFTINCYRWVDLETGVVRAFEDDLKRWHAEVKRPFMITEWSFPALDSGLPCKHGAGQRFDTQTQKAQAFTIFQRLLFATPFMVGSNYFMWADEPALGISSTFPEDSNYGLVNVENEPYKPLVEAATRLHPQVYGIHSGRLPAGERPAVPPGDAPLEPPAALPDAKAGRVALEQGDGRWKVDNGVLQLIKERPGGNAFDKVLLRGKELGLFVPVIWQEVGQGLWPQPDSARVVDASQEPTRLLLDIEFELKPASGQKVITAVDDAGKFAEAARRPGAFKTCYRFYVYPGQPWFGARFLWLENTDTRPWDFQAYFHYALSRLGGDARDDEVGGPGVPMYYAADRAVSWFDPKAKLHYGIAQGRTANFEMLFWKDPGGAQHADVRRVVRKRLKPGERYAEPQPTAYVFGAEGGPGRDAWMPVADAVRRWEAVRAEAPPQR